MWAWQQSQQCMQDIPDPVTQAVTALPAATSQVFPNIPAPGGENVGFSECARKHLAVKPRKGDAVLFHSIAPHGALEKKSLHTACPVIKVCGLAASDYLCAACRCCRRCLADVVLCLPAAAAAAAKQQHCSTLSKCMQKCLTLLVGVVAMLC
jgi:hypothetical protein